MLCSQKILGIRAGNHNMLGRIANRDPDQTTSEEAV